MSESTNLPVGFKGHLKPLEHVSPKEVIERYLTEETTTQIAKTLGVTRSGLNYWLLRTAETEWKDAQALKALRRKEEAEDAMETAHDAFTLARARELLRAAQWDLERVCRRIYGTDAPPPTSGLVINLNLGAIAAQQVAIIESDDQV
tara:strand:- start:166 stop:606 length:441 start_codon:yes stop_codon:yes gene_type:complete